MTEFTIELTGLKIRISAFYESTRTYCREYMSEGIPDFFVTITTSDIEFERIEFTKANKIEGIPVRNFSDSYLEVIALQRKITESLFQYNTLLFHGSVIAVDGVAYLFTAKSGTGKSTHTRLWREMLGKRAVMVNDDKPFISVSDDGIIVHGSPWNGKHKLGNNISVPLRAICILERGNRNEIYKMPASKAVLMLIQQSSRPKNAEMMGKYMELLDAIASKVHFYRLFCNMDPEAAEISFAEMSKEK